MEAEYRVLLLEKKINILEIVQQASEDVVAESKWEAKTCTTEQDVAKYIEDGKGLAQVLHLSYIPEVRAAIKMPNVPIHYYTYSSVRGEPRDILCVCIIGSELPDNVASPLLKAAKKYNLTICDCIPNTEKAGVVVYTAKDSVEINKTIKQHERNVQDPFIKKLWSELHPKPSQP